MRGVSKSWSLFRRRPRVITSNPATGLRSLLASNGPSEVNRLPHLTTVKEVKSDSTENVSFLLNEFHAFGSSIDGDTRRHCAGRVSNPTVRIANLNLKIFGIYVMLLLMSRPASADVITYNAVSGLLPESVGWVFLDAPDPSNEIFVSGGVLSITTTKLESTADWGYDLTSQSSNDSGMFMEVSMKLLEETHARADRGLHLFGMRNGNDNTGMASELEVWAHEDDLTVLGGLGTILSVIPFDTTDDFHVYRMELFEGRYWIFIDGELGLSGESIDIPFSGVTRAGVFGAASTFSVSSSQWTTVTIGSLADAGGPTIVPESNSLAFLGIGALGIAGRRRLKRTMQRVSKERNYSRNF